MANDTHSISETFVQIRQVRALCSTLKTDWDTIKGLYSSSIYLLTYPCPGSRTVPVPGYPFTATASPTQGLLPSTSAQESSVSHSLTPSAAGAVAALAIILALSLIGIALYILHRKRLARRKRADARTPTPPQSNPSQDVPPQPIPPQPVPPQPIPSPPNPIIPPGAPDPGPHGGAGLDAAPVHPGNEAHVNPPGGNDLS